MEPEKQKNQENLKSTKTIKTTEKDEEDVSTDEINKTLQKIARGTGIIFIGTIISMGLGFITTPLIARYLTVSQYGIYSLTLTVLSFGTTLASLGLFAALPREIPHYKEKYPNKLPDLISTAFYISLISGIFFTILLLLSKDFLARFFNETEFSLPFTIMILSLPFMILISFLSAITQGLGRVRENVYFGRIARAIIFLIGVLIIVILRLNFYLIYVMYVLGAVITLIIFFIDIKRIRIFEVRLRFNKKVARNLLKFSIPLFFTGILGYLITWMDTLMLGYFKPSSVVGLYNAAAPLVRLLPIFLSSFAFLYNPLATGLFVRNKIKELKRVYQVITKWVFLLTLPLFAIFFVFPEATITFIFGEKYISAAPALQILSLGFMFHTFLGLNGISLVVIGKPELNLYGNTLAVILNFILNIALIPKYGITGAATATTSAYIITNIFRTSYLYKETKIHPFSMNYVKPLLISFVLLGAIKITNPGITSFWLALGSLIIFLVLYLFLVLISRSIDKEDIHLFLTLEKRAGMDVRTIKRILRIFI